MDFTGKTVIVTGSTRGLGKAIAEKFAMLGANVVINGTSETVLKTEKEFLDRGYKVKAFIGDISIQENAQMLIKTAVDTYGTVDVLVNNAGIVRDRLLMKMSEEDWIEVLNVNLKSVFSVHKGSYQAYDEKTSGQDNKYFIGYRRYGKCRSGQLCCVQSRYYWVYEINSQGTGFTGNYL